jgi:hypothetical protein
VIRGVIMVNLKPDVTDEQVSARRDALEAVPFERRRSFTFGRDLNLVDDTVDLVMISEFDDEQAYRDWSVDPGHRTVSPQLLRPIAESHQPRPDPRLTPARPTLSNLDKEPVHATQLRQARPLPPRGLTAIGQGYPTSVRIGAVVVVIWLVVGLFAAARRAVFQHLRHELRAGPHHHHHHRHHLRGTADLHRDQPEGHLFDIAAEQVTVPAAAPAAGHQLPTLPPPAPPPEKPPPPENPDTPEAAGGVLARDTLAVLVKV